MIYECIVGEMIARWADLTIRQILISHAIEVMVKEATGEHIA